MTEDGTAVDRTAAYTTVRSDVTDMVPGAAMSVLDVGCSNGALGASLRGEKAGRQVWGIEFDAEFARQASERLDHVLHANLEQFDWESGLGTQRFDCVVFADVLEHLSDPPRHVRGAAARLNPGGCVVVSLPNIRHVSALASIYGRGHFPRRERGLFDGTHLRWFTLADARSMLREAGLEVEAESYAMRAGDRGGGRLNRLLNRLPQAAKGAAPLREFLTYQFCLRARPAAGRS
ncbi:MAG: class I SAM-dependent methyltransferase [Burkholderiales bacterium]|nr:class I SAM-dependent methyltransferase [Burkholderiales bacterium]